MEPNKIFACGSNLVWNPIMEPNNFFKKISEKSLEPNNSFRKYAKNRSEPNKSKKENRLRRRLEPNNATQSFFACGAKFSAGTQ